MCRDPLGGRHDDPLGTERQEVTNRTRDTLLDRLRFCVELLKLASTPKSQDAVIITLSEICEALLLEEIE